MLRLARPARRQLVFATLLGAGAAGSAIALLATSAWLISRAAQHPSVVALGVAIVGVQFFSMSRALFRYKERLVGHDAALRVMADTRASVYEHLELLAPAGLPAFRSGDLLARLVGDVDALSDLMLKVVPPFGVAVSRRASRPSGLCGISCRPPAPCWPSLWSWAPPWCPGTPSAWRGAEKIGKRRRAATSAPTSSTCSRARRSSSPSGPPMPNWPGWPAADAELTRIATASSRTAGLASGLITLLTGLAVWGILLVAVPYGALRAPAGAIAGGHRPHSTCRLRNGDRVARCGSKPGNGSGKVRAGFFRVTDASPAVNDAEVPKPVAPGPTSCAFVGRGPGTARERGWALDGVDLDLSPGRRTGVVGPSGAGKSTLAARTASLPSRTRAP